MPLKSGEELAREADKRRGEQSARIGQYQNFLHAYLGGSEGVSGLEIIPASGDGRPLQRVTKRDEMVQGRRGAPNFLKPVVDDYAALRANLPTITVMPETPDEAGMDQALRRTHALRYFYELSRMDVQQLDAAFMLSAMGDVAYVLEPLLPGDEGEDPFGPPGVYITVVNPQHAFPRFRGGREHRELHDLYLMWKIDRATAKDVYGVNVAEDWCDLIQYFSREVKQTIVGTQLARAGNIEHNLGFCPGQWVSNKATDGRFAQSDIASAVDISEEVQAMYYLYADALAWSVYPIVEIHDPANVVEQMEVGPGAKVETQETGAVRLHAPEANVQAGSMILDRVIDNLLKITGTAPIRVEGQIDRSNVSARSVAAQQGPMETRVAAQTTALGYHMERLNAKIMLMCYRIAQLRKHTFKVFGADQGRPYAEDFKGEDFGGWWRNTVKWDPLIGVSRHEKVVIAIQLYREKLVSGEYVIREAGEDDPASVVQEAVAWHKKMAELEQQAQGPPQGAPPGGPGGPPPAGQPGAPPGGGTEAAQEGAALGAGALGGPQGGGGPAGPGGAPGAGAVQPPPTAPTLPQFPTLATPPNSPAMGRPGPVPPIAQEIDAAIQSLPREFGGDIQWHLVPGGVEVMVSDHRDIRPVKLALTPVVHRVLGPDAKLKVEAARAPQNGARG